MKKLSLNEWENIIKNVSACDIDDEFGNEIEVLWLENESCDGDGEWALCHGYEIFEDGYKTELEAWRRYEDIISKLNN